MNPKKYIGDGAYAEIDAQGLIITTNNGIEDTNRIVLDPEVWSALLAFVASAKVSK